MSGNLKNTWLWQPFILCENLLLQLIESYCTHSHFHSYTELQFLFTASIFTESNLKCYAAFPVFLRKFIIIVSVFGHHWVRLVLKMTFLVRVTEFEATLLIW